jgi:hypothetical protein
MNPLLIKYSIAAAGVAVFGWLCYDYGHDSVMSDWQIERAEMANATSIAIIKLRDRQEAIQAELKDKESKSWELYQNADKESIRLNDELVNRPWRLRVITKPTDCGVPKGNSTSSMGNGGQHEVELPIETTRNVIAIGRDADRCEAKLSALQEYVKVILDAK